MNIGAAGGLPAQPAQWLAGPNNGGGVALVDPADVGLIIGTNAADVAHIQAGDGTPPATSASQHTADYIVVLADPSTVQTLALTDRATVQPALVIGFAYDTSVFGAGTGAVVVGESRKGTRKGGLFIGTGVPANAGGSNGDFALRTDTPGTVNQRLYVKSAGAWVGIL